MTTEVQAYRGWFEDRVTRFTASWRKCVELFTTGIAGAAEIGALEATVLYRLESALVATRLLYLSECLTRDLAQAKSAEEARLLVRRERDKQRDMLVSNPPQHVTTRLPSLLIALTHNEARARWVEFLTNRVKEDEGAGKDTE